MTRGVARVGVALANPATCVGSSGQPNTGGGGGAGATGGAGGSGIVFVQYQTSASLSQDLFTGGASDLRLYVRPLLVSS